MKYDFRTLERLRIGSLIALMRVRKGISLQELSSLVGVSPNNLSRIERGKYGVNLDILTRVSHALDCAVLILPHDLLHELFR